MIVTIITVVVVVVVAVDKSQCSSQADLPLPVRRTTVAHVLSQGWAAAPAVLSGVLDAPW